MATRRKAEPPRSTALGIDQLQASLPKLQRRIDDLRAFDVSKVVEYGDHAAEALAKKVDGTLQDVFGRESAEYSDYAVHILYSPMMSFSDHDPPISEVQANYRENINRAIAKFTALKELFEERIADAASAQHLATPETDVGSKPPALVSRKVFVVHGHDNGTKEAVARYLQSLDLQPVILHEQPSQGRTIIEKFEGHASEVAFAVVLFTPDDVGYRHGHEGEAKPRPRQNVVFELGFFLGALSRKRVCVLHAGGMEMPSDFAGVAYIALDPAGAWRTELAKELKAGGLAIDFNKVFA